jgi:hypothetical protein
MKKKGTTNNKIAFIEENINKFKNNQISRIDFVKLWLLNINHKNIKSNNIIYMTIKKY